MRVRALIPVATMLIVVGCGTDETEEVASLRLEIARLQEVAGAPPASLDGLYPPIAAAPVYLQEMLGLSDAFTGIVVDFSEQDAEHLGPGFEQLRSRYAAVARLVPEWADRYPVDPVDRLGAAIVSGEPEQIGAALEAVGAVCHDCHMATMAKVHYRFHWGNFWQITLGDAAGRELSYPEFMRELDAAFVGIGVDLEQGQLERARTHFETFRTRFGMLAGVCVNCHATERKYFVDAVAREAVERLGAELRRDEPDSEEIARLSQHVGMETCHRCHLVHVPAALVPLQWQAR